MAKILVTTSSNIPLVPLDSFRQGFVDALSREGNQVMVLRSNDFMRHYQFENELRSRLDAQKLLQRIRDFAPELIFSFNHAGIFPGLAESMDCKIALWLADGPAFLIDPDGVRKRGSRYQSFVPVEAFRRDLIVDFGIPAGNIHKAPFCSDFEATDSAFTNNISFVGNYFYSGRFRNILSQNIEDRALIERIRCLVESYRDNRDLPFSERVRKFQLEEHFKVGFDEAFILATLSIHQRVQVLDAVNDIGLTLYGPDNCWLDSMPASLALAFSFDAHPMVTRQALESIYNRHRININISHSQARDGLPWRVFDVMACNGALVSDRQADLKNLFGSTCNIPVYDSPAEARALCLELLSDESRRRELVHSCREAIENGHRFKHRLKSMSEQLDVNLFPGGEGKVTFLNAGDFSGSSRTPAFLPGAKGDVDQMPMSFQLFHADDGVFLQADSARLVTMVVPGQHIDISIRLKKSKKHLRFDIGDYFSMHTEPVLCVSSAIRNGNGVRASRLVDLKRGLTRTHQLTLNGEALICGNDAHCIFRNPFSGKDIELNFRSRLLKSLR